MLGIDRQPYGSVALPARRIRADRDTFHVCAKADNLLTQCAARQKLLAARLILASVGEVDLACPRIPPALASAHLCVLLDCGVCAQCGGAETDCSCSLFFVSRARKINDRRPPWLCSSHRGPSIQLRARGATTHVFKCELEARHAHCRVLVKGCSWRTAARSCLFIVPNTASLIADLRDVRFLGYGV
jgi:hypothetical protein